MHVQHCQKCIRIAFLSVRFDCRSDCGLAQNEFRKVMQVKIFCIVLEKLAQKTLYSVIVDIRVRIEIVKVDIYYALLIG
jgi:hypothetical protein